MINILKPFFETRHNHTQHKKISGRNVPLFSANLSIGSETGSPKGCLFDSARDGIILLNKHPNRSNSSAKQLTFAMKSDIIMQA